MPNPTPGPRVAGHGSRVKGPRVQGSIELNHIAYCQIKSPNADIDATNSHVACLKETRNGELNV